MARRSSYQGILVRVSLADDGTTPREPPLQESPDVSPQGDTQVTNPGTFFTGNYGQNVAKAVVATQANYVYVRGKNLGEFAQAGRAYLYWAKEEDLDSPVRWRNNGLLTGNSQDSVAIPELEHEAIGVTATPFIWSPLSSAVGQVYVLIGVIATDEESNPVPGLGDRINFDRWISSKPGVGALRFTVQAPPKPRETFSTTAPFVLANNEGEVEFWLYTEGIPVGSEVSFDAVKPDKDGNPISIPPSRVTGSPFRTGTFANLDAGYSSAVTFRLYLQGNVAVKNLVKAYAAQVQEANEAAGKEAVPADHRHPDSRGAANKEGEPRPVLLASAQTSIA
jgi:hypothetical protein